MTAILFRAAWAHALLLLAPLVLVPMGLRLVPPPEGSGLAWLAGLWRAARNLHFLAAALLVWAFLRPQGLSAGLLALPWLLTTALIALVGLARIGRHAAGPFSEICIDAALVYLAVGGGWAVLDRLGVRPLDLDAVVVLLTAVHFHYAGFVLPLLTGLAMRRVAGWAATLAGAGVIAGVPLVAAGITAGQLGFGPFLECLSAWILAAAGLLTAWLHLDLARRGDRPPLTRILWTVSAVSLVAGMVLAALYGSRYYAPTRWLDIPWMRLLHGTANALGFALLGLSGWTLAEKRPDTPNATPFRGFPGPHP